MYRVDSEPPGIIPLVSPRNFSLMLDMYRPLAKNIKIYGREMAVYEPLLCNILEL